MLNVIWPLFIIISYGYAILTNNIKNVNEEVFNSVNNAVNLSISLLRFDVFMVWNNENCTINKFYWKIHNDS